MVLKPSYKQTDLGAIPEDWGLSALGPLTKKVGSGITPRGGEKVYKTEGRPFLRSQNVGWGKFFLDDLAFIDDQTHSTFASTELEEHDVLLNITGASIGRSAITDARLIGGNVNQHVCIIRTDKNQLDPRFLNLFLLSSLGQKQIDSFQAGGNRQGLNFGQIKSFLLPLPPLPEQRAIAAALSDVDDLLTALDALIEKKRAVKQGVMQELLTGRRRLPGFSGEWKWKTLPEICWYQEGPGVRNYQFTRSGVKLLNGTNISNGYIYLDNTDRFISEKEAYGAYSHFLANKGDIVIASSGVSIEHFDEKVAFVKEEHLPLCMNTSTIRFKVYPEILDPLYLYFSLMSISFKKQIGPQATGSAQLNFGPSHLAKVFFCIPDLKEQHAIAGLLSDIDEEINVLRHQIEKTRLIKQGMMQELLTGRTRLV